MVLFFSVIVIMVAGARAQDAPFPVDADVSGLKLGEYLFRTDSTSSGQTIDYGIIVVPESRDKPYSRVIRLPFVRYRAVLENSHPPVFLLTGGPGVSNLWVDLPPVFYTHNDLVKIGYRGVDGDIKLKCPEIGKALTMETPLSPDGIQQVKAAMRMCFDRHIAVGVDVHAYNMIEVVDDLDAVRQALGYPTVSLFSTSYGTQPAYLYCVRYPDHAYRSLMVGASSREREFVYDPAMIARQLDDYNAIWKSDSEAVARSADILETIRRVQATLPPEWNGIRIDLDKLKMVTYYLLFETGSASMVFDAYIAAEKGDPSGVALLCLGWDEDVTDPSRRYWGDFFSKIVSGRRAGWRDTPTFLHDGGGLVVSALSSFWWDCANQDGWPIRSIPEEYCRIDTVATEMLIVNGNLDFTSPPDYIRDEVMPYLENGHFAVISNMGHMDVIRLQRDAFEHMVNRFYIEGVVDTARYVPHRIDFTPEETYQGYARQLFPQK
jgi:pimeloyl-ACP methyl ester carboxylesterase